MRRDEERVFVHGFDGFGWQESFWRANAKVGLFVKNGEAAELELFVLKEPRQERT